MSRTLWTDSRNMTIHKSKKNINPIASRWIIHMNQHKIYFNNRNVMIKARIIIRVRDCTCSLTIMIPHFNRNLKMWLTIGNSFSNLMKRCSVINEFPALKKKQYSRNLIKHYFVMKIKFAFLFICFLFPLLWARPSIFCSWNFLKLKSPQFTHTFSRNYSKIFTILTRKMYNKKLNANINARKYLNGFALN